MMAAVGSVVSSEAVPRAVEPMRHRSVSGVTTNKEAQASSVLDAP